MRRALPIPLLLAALALALSGCGGGSSGSSAGGGATTTADGAVVIHMKNIQFQPKTLTVKVGQKVTWVNDDVVQHDVQSQSGPEQIDSPLYGNGKSWSFTPTKAGTYKYVCSIHPGMEGTLIVE